MKLAIHKTVDISYLKLTLPVRYEDEQLPYEFPFRKGDVWEVHINLDNHTILGWSTEEIEHVYLKVVDTGIYTLLDGDNNVVACLDGEYVPHGLIPGEWGDYVSLVISETGEILNWPTDPNFDDFHDIFDGDGNRVR